MGPIDEFIAAGEYIVANGNPNLVFCPRGTMPNLDGYRNHPDEIHYASTEGEDVGTGSG